MEAGSSQQAKQKSNTYEEIIIQHKYLGVINCEIKT